MKKSTSSSSANSYTALAAKAKGLPPPNEEDLPPLEYQLKPGHERKGSNTPRSGSNTPRSGSNTPRSGHTTPRGSSGASTSASRDEPASRGHSGHARDTVTRSAPRVSAPTSQPSPRQRADSSGQRVDVGRAKATTTGAPAAAAGKKGILKTCSFPNCNGKRDKSSQFCLMHSGASVGPADPEPDSDDPSCATCGQAFGVGESYLTALGGSYHADCFSCNACGKVLSDSEDPVYSFEGKPYCERDYMDKFAKKCSRCCEEIAGKFFRAMDRDWHEECLSCFQCKTGLVGQPIFHRSPDGQYADSEPIYCENCYQGIFGETCAACGKTLVGKMLKALDEKWHPECFCCAECQEPLGTSFFVENNNVYCRKHFEELFATRCGGCGEVVQGACLKALNKTWHRDCFQCSHCKKPLTTDKFYQEGEDVFCLKDYEELYAVRCAGCNDYITGSVLHVLDKDWHRDCFVCAECKNPLDDGFLRKDDKVYCEKDYARLFDLACAGCGETVVGQYVEVLGFVWHRQCFLCTTCLKPIQGDACFVQDNRVYCAEDFRKLLLAQGRGGNIDDANYMPDQYMADRARGDLPYDKFAKHPASYVGIDEADRSGPRGARFGRDAVKSGKAKITMEIKTAPTAQRPQKPKKAEVKDDDEDTGVWDVRICTARGIETALATRRKRLFRCDFKDSTVFKPEVRAGVFTFTEFAPSIFQALRTLYGIENESFVESICASGALGGEPGVHYWTSRDRRFVVEVVPEDEAQFFLKIFDKYHKHLVRHPHTLLPRYFGLYEVRMPGSKAVRVMVRNNIFDTNMNVQLKYDIQGQGNRLVDEKQVKEFIAQHGAGAVPILKDLNFKGKLALIQSEGAAFRQQLTRDISLLKSCDITGQSLMIGVTKGQNALPNRAHPGNTQSLLKPLAASYKGKAHGLASIFQADNGGLRSEKGGEVYFFGIINVLRTSEARGIRRNVRSFHAIESKKFNTFFEKYLRDLVA